MNAPCLVPRGPFGQDWERWLLSVVIGLCLAGCNVTRGVSDAARPPIQQMLLTQSMQRSLEEAVVPFAPGETIVVETAWPTTHADFAGDKEFALQILNGWFAQKGLRINTEDAGYLVRVTLHAFGFDKAETFVGIPPIQSVLIPFSVPELTFYGAISHRGYTRFTMDLYEKKTGRLIGTMPMSEAVVHLTRYTVLFLITFDSTDMIPPPL